MLLRLITCLTTALVAAAVAAGQYNDKLNVGDRAPAWKDLPGVDGRNHSLADLDPRKPVIVVFTCNSCDVAAGYEDRIIAFARRHADDAAVVAINVSAKPADSLDRMRERAREKKFPFPYLYDQSQAIGLAYGANYTPEFFVLSAKDRRIVYMGGMDDSTYADRVRTSYLEPAVAAALAGRAPDIAETPPRGCRVKYPRKRK